MKKSIELSKVVDTAINKVTIDFINKDLFNMKQEGCPLPCGNEFLPYVEECRNLVSEILIQSN